MKVRNPKLKMILLSIVMAVIIGFTASVDASLDSFQPQYFDIAPPQYWSSGFVRNSSTNLGSAMGCTFCGEIFYNEPPPDNIMYIPSPPMHPSFSGANIADTVNSGKQQSSQPCNFCNSFYNGGEPLSNYDDEISRNMNNRAVALLIAFSSISAVLCLYILGTKRSKILASLNRTKLFKTGRQTPNSDPHAHQNHHHHHHPHHQNDKSNTLNESITNTGVHLSDPCYLQTNRDKNLTSPIISDHVPHKKTAIPSKYWAQPGSIIGRTIRRIPNEYEVPSSQTNSTGTSSAVYADMNNENNQRFFSPYNLHTYAEVREVLDPNEHFHTSSNSSAMLSESNYDNAVYSHGGCVLASGAMMGTAPNGSVQMSDFNSMRPVQSMAYGQPTSINQHHQSNQAAKFHHNSGQTIYEQPPQRAQVIITSNNQGVNPTLLNYKDRIHNVI